MKKCKHGRPHKYYRAEMNGDKVWACANGCGHYMPKHLEYLVANRQSLCTECGEEFTLVGYAMTMDNPKCLDCRGLSEDKTEEKEMDPLENFPGHSFASKK